MQRPSTSSLRSDCLQRSSPKAVKLFNNPEFLFLVIAALHQLTTEMSSHLLMAKVLTTSSSHHADQPPWFVNRLNWCARWLMGYTFPRPPQWRHRSLVWRQRHLRRGIWQKKLLDHNSPISLSKLSRELGYLSSMPLSSWPFFLIRKGKFQERFHSICFWKQLPFSKSTSTWARSACLQSHVTSDRMQMQGRGTTFTLFGNNFVSLFYFIW